MINQSQMFWIYCDHRYCGRSLQRVSVAALQVAARRRGWAVGSIMADDKSPAGKDYCPVHRVVAEAPLGEPSVPGEVRVINGRACRWNFLVSTWFPVHPPQGDQ